MKIVATPENAPSIKVAAEARLAAVLGTQRLEPDCRKARNATKDGRDTRKGVFHQRYRSGLPCGRAWHTQRFRASAPQ